jgi:thioesterase domain-containing protein
VLSSDHVWHVFVRDVAAAAGVQPPHVDVDTLRGLDLDAVEDLALDELGKIGLAPADMRRELRVRMRVVAANQRALYEHQPQAYDGRFVLVHAADGDLPLETARWQAVAPHLERRTVPGDHHTMLQPPHLNVLAAVVRDVLGD